MSRTWPHFAHATEIAGALDALTRIEMQQLIERLWLQHSFTVLLVTHDAEDVADPAAVTRLD